MSAMESDDDEKPRYIFVIGAPGAGKGTLGKRLAQEYKLTHISVGDLLREKADEDANIRMAIESNELLPSQYLFPVLREAFRDAVSGYPVVLDGFPRRVEQIREFEKAFDKPLFVLFFQCPKFLAKERVLERQDGRAGDTDEVFEKRYKEYLELNPPILDYYGSSRGKNNLVEVNTSAASSEEWWENLLAALKGRNEGKQLLSRKRGGEVRPWTGEY